MKSVVKTNYAAVRAEGRDTAELLVLPDGRILVHNLTPAVAAVLAELAPDDETMRRRATSAAPSSALPVPNSPLHAPRSKLLPP